MQCWTVFEDTRVQQILVGQNQSSSDFKEACVNVNIIIVQPFWQCIL